mmetsp:Transcript_10613/g.37374  ORF Transcript_10613/g.37374 Transcript_10613/m.37374 type:complete len:369 (+) Transcript_10613:2657-3763(+)
MLRPPGLPRAVAARRPRRPASLWVARPRRARPALRLQLRPLHENRRGAQGRLPARRGRRRLDNGGPPRRWLGRIIGRRRRRRRQEEKEEGAGCEGEEGGGRLGRQVPARQAHRGCVLQPPRGRPHFPRGHPLWRDGGQARRARGDAEGAHLGAAQPRLRTARFVQGVCGADAFFKVLRGHRARGHDDGAARRFARRRRLARDAAAGAVCAPFVLRPRRRRRRFAPRGSQRAMPRRRLQGRRARAFRRRLRDVCHRRRGLGARGAARRETRRGRGPHRVAARGRARLGLCPVRRPFDKGGARLDGAGHQVAEDQGDGAPDDGGDDSFSERGHRQRRRSSAPLGAAQRVRFRRQPDDGEPRRLRAPFARR